MHSSIFFLINLSKIAKTIEKKRNATLASLKIFDSAQPPSPPLTEFIDALLCICVRVRNGVLFCVKASVISNDFDS